jgi:hypothetical protein
LAVKGTYALVCDALRPGVAQGALKPFFTPPGDGAADDAKRKNQNSQNSKFQKLKNAKTKISKTSIANLFPRDRSRNYLARDRFLVSQISGKTFDSLSLRSFVSFAPFAMCEVYI